MKELSHTIPTHLMRDPVEQAPKAKNTMGKDDFMKLLMTQLQHQDPLNPMDHKEFGAQLAQFGSLEQLQNIGKGIENLQTGYGEGSKLNALGMIGKKVEAGVSEVDLIEGQDVSFRYNSKQDVRPIKAHVYTEGGKLIRDIEIDPKSKSQIVQWDGKDQEGNKLPSGKYTFRVQGIDKAGQAVELGSELSGRVTGVDVGGKTPMLIVQTESGSVRMELSKVKNISSEVDTTSTKEKSLVSPSTAANSSIPVQTEGMEIKQADAESMPSAEANENLGMWQGIPGLSQIAGN